MANGALVNPRTGVSNIQVTTPANPPSPPPYMVLIPTPLELLMAINLWFTDSNPLIGASCLILEIVELGTSAINEDESTTSFVFGLYKIRSGAFK